MAKLGKTSKADRNKLTCTRYRLELRREKSKAKRLMGHIRRCPWDTVARTAFAALPVIARAHRGELPVLVTSPKVDRRKAGVTLTQIKNQIRLAKVVTQPLIELVGV